jgi:hypothetical protein
MTPGTPLVRLGSGAKFSWHLNLGTNRRLRPLAIMDTVLSFLISAGIIAFGVWVVVATIAAGLPLAWTLLGLLPVIVGSFSLIKRLGTPRT